MSGWVANKKLDGLMDGVLVFCFNYDLHKWIMLAIE